MIADPSRKYNDLYYNCTSPIHRNMEWKRLDTIGVPAVTRLPWWSSPSLQFRPAASEGVGSTATPFTALAKERLELAEPIS